MSLCATSCSNIFLVCPMKNVPVLVKREGDEYKHFPLPTDGEVCVCVAHVCVACVCVCVCVFGGYKETKNKIKIRVR